jgi:4-alpha-glucanotransferase
MAPGERSPYAAMSAFAMDPLYVSLTDVEDFAAAGGEAALAAAERVALAAARARPDIDYDGVRALKRHALEIAHARFVAAEWQAGSARAEAFRRFREAEAEWLADYALFRACQERAPGRTWQGWEPALRDREPAALAAARHALAPGILFHEYVQWLAAEQWGAARRTAAATGVWLAGDLPFVVAPHSADAWARRDEFALDVRLGAPPDTFADGQDWGLPVCRWDVMARGDFAWLRARVAHAAVMFDAFRVDHVVGLYRQWVIPPGGQGAFVPAEEADQAALGDRLLRVALDAARGAEVIAEDLGVIPPFVRRSLAALDLPGYRVMRWEEKDGAYRDPRDYPRRSVATSGTHDTSTLAVWWEEELTPERRQALAAAASFAALADAGPRFTPAVHAALLDALYAAGSELVVLPFQDAYGGRERINVPATVGTTNWAYRLPWTVEELAGPAGAGLRDQLRALAARHGR